jgi:hypothetical protein
MNPLPIHRWLTFVDSWPPSSVEYLLDCLRIESSDVIYDPFVGCGTTPVVCAHRGLATCSGDISNLAVLTTRIKLEHPSLKELDGVERIFQGVGPQTLLRCFAEGSLSHHTSASILHILQFVLAAAVLRIGWDGGSDLDLDHLGKEVVKLINEMRTDIEATLGKQSAHRVSLCEFLAADLNQLRQFSRTGLAMISSPPFFGSNTNPTMQRIADLLGEPAVRQTEVRRSPAWQVPEARPILDSVPRGSELYDAVADYLFFLDWIVAHTVATGCRAVAIEMGPKTVGDVLLPFDVFVAQRLLANRYEIGVFETIELEPEVSTVVCAQRRQ